MFETRTGNRLTSESSEAADLYQEAVDLILGSESGASVLVSSSADQQETVYREPLES